MPYAPPAGDAVDFRLVGGYAPPAGDAVDFDLGDVFVEMVAVCGVDLTIIATAVAAPLAVDLAIATEWVVAPMAADLAIATEWLVAPFGVGLEQYLQSTLGVDLPFWSEVVSVLKAVNATGWPLLSTCRVDLSTLVEVVAVASVSLEICHLEVIAPFAVDLSRDELSPVVSVCSALLITIKPDLPDDVPAPTIAVVVDGTIWPLSSLVGLKLSRRLDQYAITGTVDFAEIGDYLACALGRQVVIHLAGQDIVLRVADLNRSRRHLESGYSVSLASPSYWLDAPHAETIDGELTGMASAIADQLAGSVPLSWQTVDGHIPAGAMIAAGQSPLELLRGLAGAPGAVLQSTLSGGLVVRPEYRRSVPEWPTALPDITIAEADVGIALAEREEYRDGCNAVQVSNTAPDGDESGGLRLESTANDDGTITWRVYSDPWDPAVTLRHTGGSWVQLQLVGDRIETETETVTIVDGAGRVNYPVAELLGHEWLRENLGAVEVQADGTVASEVSGESLVAITYRTRCRVWLAIDPRDEDVLFVAESPSRSRSVISLLYQRGDGSRRGEDIVDPLVASAPVAHERARNFVDRHCSRRQIMPITMPLAEIYEMGILAQVIDVEGPVWRGMVVAQDIDWQSGDDGSQDIETTVEIEREAA